MRVVICGAGQVGYGIAEKLAAEKNDVSVIDLSPELIRNVRDALDVRGANLEIRFALREFATARTGVDTSAMTAAQARGDRRTRPLAALLENSSVPTFAPTTRARLARSLDQARKRVRTW